MNLNHLINRFDLMNFKFMNIYFQVFNPLNNTQINFFFKLTNVLMMFYEKKNGV